MKTEMRRTFSEQEQKNLIKKFHVLLSKVGFNGDDREAILAEYKVKTTKDLSCRQLIEICNRLSYMLSPDLAEIDKYRKRVIAAISKWLQNKGLPASIEYIKSVACKSAAAETFNAIPLSKLRAIYSTFCTYNKVNNQTQDVVEALDEASEPQETKHIDYSQIKPLGNA